MRVNTNVFAIAAALLFTIALLGAVGWIGNTNVEAFKDAGLASLALSAVISFGFSRP